ncbi:DUF4355 domain-containing protein [Bacillus wiedmannii]|uniref:DUF4355 domain-containing protein n=1 Tax=Bacillus wiedmannii TaxID=1890302 RepID=UPI000BF0FAF2|nr:DUF4355 domain-containing protein [Bacillus wiedmannii]PEO38289.1 hypothetical protein CN555_13855 [Bacillus wiedmannii]UOB95807.1 hypothetical protein BTI679_31510 [Bacillus wiedmannii]
MSEVQVTLEQVQELVKSNPEVRDALKSEFITPEAFTVFAQTDEGKKALQPEFDRRATGAIDTWKKNNLEKIKQDAILAANPADTPEQRQIRDLQEQFNAEKRKATLAEQSAYALALANQKGLPTGLISYFVGENQEATLQGINTYEMEFNSALQQYVESQLGATGRNHLPNGYSAAAQQTETPKKTIGEMSYEEAARQYMANPNKFSNEYLRR